MNAAHVSIMSRCQSVAVMPCKDYVLLKGVKLDQVEVIGYGEEIPAVFGHDESAWGKNRRVEIRYAGE